MREAGLIPDYRFELDLHAEVFEACAYHFWGLFENPACNRSPRSARSWVCRT
jgi:deoxyhypusine synthase